MKYKFLTVSIPILLLIVASFYITSQFIQPAPKKELVIATGSTSGNYYTTALAYQALLKEEGIDVKILNTAGSVENLELLKQKKADIAFVQNGIAGNQHNVELLASIYYEPLWIFYKNDKYKMDYVIELIGRTIAVGQSQSGTEHLSRMILNDNGINTKNSNLVNLPTLEAKEKLISGDIDALFIVSSAQSSAVQSLLEDPNVNVLSIKRAKAYSRKYAFLEALSLYEGTIDLYKNLPDEDIKLLATTANLVVNHEVPAELIRILMKKVKLVHSQKTLFAKDNQFPNTSNTTLAINEEANKYLRNGDSFLEKIFPYWIASNIDRLKILLIPLLTLLFPLFKGVLPLYQWTMRSKIYKWYDQVNELDQKIPAMKKVEVEQTIKDLDALKIEIQTATKVPLSFMGEYYNLLMHIDMIRNKLDRELHS